MDFNLCLINNWVVFTRAQVITFYLNPVQDTDNDNSSMVKFYHLRNLKNGVKSKLRDPNLSFSWVIVLNQSLIQF